METKKWINDILNSTDGMTKVVPNDLLFAKIQNRIQNKNNTVSKQWIWIAAASFVLLFTLNASIIVGKLNKKESQIEMIASTVSKTDQLY